MTLEEAICILNQNNWRGGHWQLHSSGYGIQNNSDTYSLDTLKLFHEDAIAIAKSIHLEAALAECEREKVRQFVRDLEVGALAQCELCRAKDRATKQTDKRYWHGDPKDFRTNPVICPAHLWWTLRDRYAALTEAGEQETELKDDPIFGGDY